MKAEKLLKKFQKRLKAISKTSFRLNLLPFFRRIFVLMMVLSMAIWIFLGGSLSIFVIQNFRNGTFNKVLGANGAGTGQIKDGQVQQPQAQEQQQAEKQQPTEANIPRVGRVNIACVKNALSDTSIKNLIVAENTSVLTADEKIRFEKCLVNNN